MVRNKTPPWIFVTVILVVLQGDLSRSQTATPLHTAPRFVSEPQDTVAEASSSVTLKCSATGNPPPVYAWRKDGTEIDLQTKTQLSLTTSGDLIIKQFDATEDVGLYQCMATTSDSAVRLVILSRPAKVAATESPSTFKQQPTATTGYISGAVRLAVDISNAIPSPDIVWKYRTKSTILSSDDRFSVLPQGVIVITNVQASDEGEIRAIARLSNGQYVNSDYVKVTVKQANERPGGQSLSFLGRPQDASLKWGQSTIIECSGDSSSPISYSWLKDGVRIQYDSRIALFGGSHLKLSYVTEAESGLYTCEMNSGSSTLQASATVNVQVPPTFTLVPSTQYGRVDGSVTFEYKIKGNPKPSVTWYHDGIKVPSVADYIDYKDGSLVLKGIISNDAGMYQVFASSAVGIAQATTELIVLERGVVIPTTVPQPPIGPTSTGALKPGKVKNVNGYSTSPVTITVAWQQPDVPNGEIEKYVIVYFSSPTVIERQIVNGTQFSATLKDLDPSTSYSIRLQAVNQYGGGALSSTVSVTTPPPTPPKVSTLTTTASTPDSVYVSWPAPPSGTIISKYVLFYSDTTNSPLTILSRATTSTSLLVDNLTPDTSYKFWVVPYNGNIEGPKSDEYPITTPKAFVTKPGAVGSVVASAASSTIVTLNWNAPTSGDAVTKYEVTVMNADEPTLPVTKRTTSTTTAFLTGLQPDTNYKIFVVPYSGDVAGPPSVDLLTKTPADFPSISPTGFSPGPITDNSALFRWVPLTKTEANGVVTGYELRVRIAGEKDSSKTISIPGPAREYMLAGLDPGKDYIVRLAAVTSAGAGPFGTQLKITTKAATGGKVPSAPLNFQGTPLVNDPGVVTLSWQPPLEPNGAILRYSIVKVTTTGSWTEMTTAGTTLAMNVSTFALDSNHVIQIFATNQFGDGTKNIPITVTTLSETSLPKAPTGLNINPTKSSMTISWLPPKDETTVIRRYNVIVRKASTNELLFSTPVNGRKNTFIHITDKIEPGMAYDVSVVAVNKLGSSSSIKGSVTTLKNDATSIVRQSLSVGSHFAAFNWTDTLQTMAPAYFIKFYRLNALGERLMEVVPATGNNFIVRSLRPSTQYAFYIRRSYETSFPDMPFVVITTKADSPSAPLDLTARMFGDTWIDLSWQAPYWPSGKIINYKIIYSTDNTEEFAKRPSIKTIDGSMVYNLTGLTEGTRYYFNVLAIGVAGAGALSSTLATSTASSGGIIVPGGLLPLGGGAGGIAANLWWIILAIILLILLLLLLLLLIYCCCCSAGGCLCCQKWCPCCWSCWLVCCLPCLICCCPCCCSKHKKMKKHEQHLYVAAPVGGTGSIASSTYHANGYASNAANGYAANANGYASNANNYSSNTNTYSSNANGYSSNANGYASMESKSSKRQDAPPDLWMTTGNSNNIEMSTLRSNGGLDLTLQSGATPSIRSSSHSLNKSAYMGGASGIKVAVPGDSTFISYKTSLQDYCQKIGWLPAVYSTQQYKGGYTGTSTFAGQSFSSGTDYGSTRIDAEQRSAFAALMSLNAVMGASKYNAAANIAVPSPGESSFISYKCSLHDFCQQCNILPPRFTTSKQGGMYASQVQVGSHTFSMDGVLTSRQDVEQQVAFAALKGLCMNETGATYNPTACFTVAGPNSPRFVSFKSSLEEFCQQYKLPPPQYITTQTVQGYSSKLKFGGLFFQSNDYLPTRLEAEQHAAFEALQGLGLLESSVQFGSGDTERIGHGSSLSINSTGQTRIGGGSRYGSSSQLSQSSHTSDSFAYRQQPPMPRSQFGGSSDITSGYASADGGVNGHTRLTTSYSTGGTPSRLRSSSFDTGGDASPRTNHHQRSFSSSTSYQQTNVRNVQSNGRAHESNKVGQHYRTMGPSVRSQRIYGSASHVNEYSAPNYLETRSVSHPALTDLENEMAGLEGLIRDLNGITSNERVKETYA